MRSTFSSARTARAGSRPTGTARRGRSTISVKRTVPSARSTVPSAATTRPSKGMREACAFDHRVRSDPRRRPHAPPCHAARPAHRRGSARGDRRASRLGRIPASALLDRRLRHPPPHARSLRGLQQHRVLLQRGRRRACPAAHSSRCRRRLRWSSRLRRPHRPRLHSSCSPRAALSRSRPRAHRRTPLRISVGRRRTIGDAPVPVRAFLHRARHARPTRNRAVAHRPSRLGEARLSPASRSDDSRSPVPPGARSPGPRRQPRPASPSGTQISSPVALTSRACATARVTSAAGAASTLSRTIRPPSAAAAPGSRSPSARRGRRRPAPVTRSIVRSGR